MPDSGETPTSATASPSAPFSGTLDSGLSPQQFEQVSAMIERVKEDAADKLTSLEQRLLRELPGRPFILKTVAGLLAGMLTIGLTILGLFFAFISHGRDQFGAGAQFATGTVNQYIDAKKAHEDQTKQLKEVFDYMKRKDDPPKQSKPQ